MAEQDQIQSNSLTEAKLAMEDSLHREKREREATEQAKRQHEAELAMEGYEHKIKRELQEKATREAELVKKMEAERQETERLASEKAQQLKEQADKATEAERERQEEARYEELKKNEELINKIKQKETLDIPTVRTIKSDVVQSVASSKVQISELAKPGQGREMVFDWKRNRSEKNYLLIILSSLLILTVVIGISFILLSKRTAYENRPELSVTSSLIFADFHKSINVYDRAPETVIQLIKNEKNLLADSSKADSLFNLYLISASPLVSDYDNNQKPLNFSGFLKATGLSLPDELKRSLTEDYMLGTYKAVPGSAFIVLKIKSYDLARGTLLKTENATISTLFAPLLNKPVGKALLENKFRDQIIKNVDTRVLTTDSGEVATIYTFADRQTLIIASDEATFTKVLLSYLTPKPTIQ